MGRLQNILNVVINCTDNTGKITFYKQLESYATEVEHSLKVAKEGFDWDAFEANRGADMDIDICR